MARAYSLDLRDALLSGGCGWSELPAGGIDLRGQRGERGEVVAAVRATGSAAARRRGGNRPYALAGERDWLLARLAEKPDVTLRALVAELAERGIKVSYYAVWHFFEHEGISFKKKPARQRAGSPRRRQAAGAVEEVSRPA